MTIERDAKMMHQSEGSMRYAWLGDRKSKNTIQTEVEGESDDSCLIQGDRKGTSAHTEKLP